MGIYKSFRYLLGDTMDRQIALARLKKCKEENEKLRAELAKKKTTKKKYAKV